MGKSYQDKTNDSYTMNFTFKAKVKSKMISTCKNNNNNIHQGEQPPTSAIRPRAWIQNTKKHLSQTRRKMNVQVLFAKDTETHYGSVKHDTDCTEVYFKVRGKKKLTGRKTV